MEEEMTPEERADRFIKNWCRNVLHIHGPGGCFECTALIIREAENDALERAAKSVDITAQHCRTTGEMEAEDNEHILTSSWYLVADEMTKQSAAIRALKTEAPK